jgi:hypothetical protein
MRSYFAALLGAIVPAVLSLTCPFGAAAAPASPEYALKAAFIYNFAMFTTWAERPDKTISLCVLGRDPLGSAIDLLEGKEVGLSRLSIVRLRSVSEVTRNCQIVFVADAEVDNYLGFAEYMRHAPGVLTISDKEGAARQGIIIELTAEGKNIGFVFNQEAARLANVQISSKLLRIARKVY